ncbi:MAG: MMPL family transporter, partial [Bacteroidales bacterium]|nr:MMPL family transporter [Bacteroidales bacterium]
MKIKKINLWFKKQASSIIKFRWLIIAVFLLAVASGFFGLKRMVVEYSNDGYFLPDDPMVVMTDEFKEIFGNDYYVGVLVESDALFTKKNLELLRELSNELLDSVPYADKLTSLTDIEFTVGTEYGMEIIQIVPEEIPADKTALEEIRKKAYSKKNFAEKLVSKDGKYTWITMKLLTFPEYHKEKGKKMPEIQVGEKVEQIITQKKYKSLHPRGTGMPYLNYKKSVFFDAESPRVMGLALLIAFIFLAFSTRSIRGVIVPIVSAIGSVIIVFGAVGFLNIPIDGSILSIPILLSIAISIGYSIHIFTFFKKHKRETGKRKESVIFALEETGWPLFFTGLTTISALLSFLIIPVQSVRLIGLITASNVAAIFLIVMFLMPALLSFGKDSKPKNNVKRDTKSWLAFRLEKFGNWILNYPKIIITVSIIIAGILIYGMTKVEAAFDVEKTMGTKIPYVKNLVEISETELGSLYSYDLMIEFPEEGMAKQPEILKKFDELTQYVNSFELTKRTTTVLDIIKDMNQVLNEDNEEYYNIPDNREQVAQMLLLYENAGGTEAEYWMDYEYRRLRMMIEVKTYNSKELKYENELLHKKAEELFPNARLSVVG